MSLKTQLFFSLVLGLHLSNGEQPVEEDLIVPAHVKPLGGLVKVNPESPDVQEAAQKALEKFNEKSKTKNLFKLLEVTSAESQVTNRITFKIDAVIGKTKCQKPGVADMESCVLRKKRRTCQFEVAFNPMTNEHEVLNSSCKKSDLLSDGASNDF